jgi:hypothetical protein
MADEIKVKITKDITRIENIQNQKSQQGKIVRSEGKITEKTEISETAKILTEFVPKIIKSIQESENVERESKPAENSQIAASLIEELIKSILTKKLQD